MGEYAVRKSDNERVKIGTCESMYYLRYEDREKVDKESNSINPATEKELFWRLPFPDEDNVSIGEYDPFQRGYRLYQTIKENGKEYHQDFEGPDTVDSPGTIQLKHTDSGLMFNVNCYHGIKLPKETDEIKPFWNGKGWFFELVFIKNTENGIVPIVQCRHCHRMWRYSWEEILPYIQDETLKERLEQYV